MKGTNKVKTKRIWTLEHTFPWILTIGGAIGFIASFALTYDKIKIAANPNYIPNCNFNPILSCSSVIKTWQASAMGFPNSFIGLGGFAVVITIGVAILVGMKPRELKRWFWWGLNLGSLLGVSLVSWLQYQPIYVIHALCPWCMVVWTVTIPIFLYTTLYNLRVKFVPTPEAIKKPAAYLEKHHGDVLVVWALIILAMITTHFWYYWKTLI